MWKFWLENSYHFIFRELDVFTIIAIVLVVVKLQIKT